MKINNTRKIVVSTLALAMGAALAGSVAGSVAWYQYSTRATSMLSGTSVGSSRHLQIANVLVDDEADDNQDDTHWGYNYAPEAKDKFAPSTALFNDGVIESFASHPVYQHFNNWVESSDDNFFSYDLYLQSIDENKDREELDVYLTAIDLKVNDTSGTGIIEEALRIELVPYTFDGTDWIKGTSRILSKTAGTTNLKDYLNLNKEDNFNMDRDGFAADDSMGDAKEYKANTPVLLEAGSSLVGYFKDGALTKPAHFEKLQKANGDSGEDLFEDEALSIPAADPIVAAGYYYKEVKADGVKKYYKANQDSYITKAYEDIVANDDNPYDFDGGQVLFKTNDTYAVKLTVKIWLEGWQQGENEAVVLPAGTEAIGYYKDANLSEAADNFHEVVLDTGDDAKGLYTDNTLATPVNNYHSVEGVAGTVPSEDLYEDTALTIPAELDGENKLVNDGTYYAAGAAAGTYFAKGVAADTYYTKGYIWDKDTIGSTFNLGLRFAVEAEQ